jgi:hypothetical protein
VYDHLVGTVVEHAPGRLVLRAGGIGYELATPLTARFPESGSASTASGRPSRCRCSRT